MTERFVDYLKSNRLSDAELKRIANETMDLLPLCRCSLFCPPGCTGKQNSNRCLVEEIAKTDPRSAAHHRELQAQWRAKS